MTNAEGIVSINTMNIIITCLDNLNYTSE